MKIPNLFKDALIYPVNNWKKFIIVGILALFIIPNLFLQAGYFNSYLLNDPQGYFELNILLYIISFLVSIFILGYGFSIIKNTINNPQKSPNFNIKSNFTDGLKVFLINVIYFLIPFLALILIFSYVFYPFDYMGTILVLILNSCSILVVTVFLDFTLFNIIPFIIAFTINLVIPSIMVILSLFQLIAIARFADKKDFKSSFNLKEIMGDIKNIGWKKYIIFIICLYGLYFLISFITTFLIVLPLFLQVILMYLIFYPYLIFISSRAVGLIYSELKR